MSFLGSCLYRFRRFGQHGLRVAWYRDIVRPRILRTTPIENLTDDRCGIHVLTSDGDWLNLVWSLKSFYWASGRRYRLCIHEDGTVGAEGLRHLREHFPDARIIRKTAADAEVLPTLETFPQSLEFRKTNHLSPKLFDFRHYLTTERMLLFDSDLIFFREPTELLRRIESDDYRLNSVNKDVQSAYTVDPAQMKTEKRLILAEGFNSGLGLIHRESLKLEWIEEFLAIPGILGHFWRIEQTLFALCSARFGCELLPSEYRIQLGPGIEGCVEKHYVGAVRHLMYGEGMAALKKAGMLEPLAERLR